MDRHPPIKGGVNFRDFGGYHTADGGKVKWRKLFRSGHLAGLTDEDHTHLNGMDLGVICDFRTDWENEREPARLPEHLSSRVVRFNIWPKSARTVNRMIKALDSGQASEEEIYESQNVVYREFVVEFSDKYAAMFRHILDGQGRAVLIHCAGGKDRTGLGAALLHSALGVPEDTIHEDYILTNRGENLTQFLRDLAEKNVSQNGAIPNDDIETVFNRFMRLFGARTDSLRAAFEAIHGMAGSVEGYIRDVLKVTDADKAKLRTWFVE